jgi:hypothetical protein
VKATEAVRTHFRVRYVIPARRSGIPTFTVVAGEVHNELGFHGRVPLVCQALGSKKLLEENGLVLEKMEGPPSGLSTTVRFTYRLAGGDPAKPVQHPLWKLQGIGKAMYGNLGGGESFLRAEREAFDRGGREKE